MEYDIALEGIASMMLFFSLLNNLIKALFLLFLN
jgi:hypothetical protein